MKRQQCLDGPAMIRDASGHRRCCPATGGGQTRMWCAKIIDCTNKIHAVLQCQRTARQRATSACQRGQTLTERCVEPLDVGRIDDPVALRAPSERLDACRRAIDNAAFGLDHPSPLVALDDLGEQDMAPWTQPGPSTRARMYGIAKGLPNGPDVRHQAIGTDQQGTMCRTAPHALDQSSDQRHVTLLADFAAQPQARLDHHGQCHPYDAALFLHADLIGLYVPQVAWWLDQMLLHGLPLFPGACPPRGNGPLVKPKGHDDRLPWAAVRHQGHHETDRLRRSPQAIQRGAFRRRERLTTRRADEALLLARVDADVALACLSSGGTDQIGAECACGVHDVSPLLALLASMPRKSMSGPPFSLQAHLTTV